MPFLNSRLFFRIIKKNREVYTLKVITLAVTFACTMIIILFSLNEFQFDRFHHHSESIFRVIQKNKKDHNSKNPRSNRIPPEVVSVLKLIPNDSVIVSRIKELAGLGISIDNHRLTNQKIHAADPEIINIFSFDILEGALNKFRVQGQNAMLSSSAALQYFGTVQAVGKQFTIYTLGDTLQFTVAAIFKDYPKNSHDEFNVFVKFNALHIQSLWFNPEDTGIYCRVLLGNIARYEESIENLLGQEEFNYNFQPIADIYFAPRVLGEDVKHGDNYSVLILIGITCLIFFLALTSYINLSTLILPHRSKELAIKKLAGSNQLHLILTFVKESFTIVGISLILGVVLLLSTAELIEPILSINFIQLLVNSDLSLSLVMIVLFFLLGLSPIFMTLNFIRSSPIRLLSADTITFPNFNRAITFLQVGVCLFLIFACLVIKRQINYSLLKEPGRNYDQVVYMTYPPNLNNDALKNLRSNWRKNNSNIIDVTATSQLPNQISGKKIDSDVYILAVDNAFQEFYDLKMLQGEWFYDGDTLLIVNEKGMELLSSNPKSIKGVIEGVSGQFNLPHKPLQINLAPYYNYNYLNIRILEVDIRSTVSYLSTYFGSGSKVASISLMNKQFRGWLEYENLLNALSGILAIISMLLSCCTVYGISISLVRDKLKHIAIRKMFGATTLNITYLLVKEFARPIIMAILIIGPLSYIILKDFLRNFVYSTGFIWSDAVFPIAFCGTIIFLVCYYRAIRLNQSDLSSSLKGIKA